MSISVRPLSHFCVALSFTTSFLCSPSNIIFYSRLFRFLSRADRVNCANETGAMDFTIIEKKNCVWILSESIYEILMQKVQAKKFTSFQSFLFACEHLQVQLISLVLDDFNVKFKFLSKYLLLIACTTTSKCLQWSTPSLARSYQCEYLDPRQMSSFIT